MKTIISEEAVVEFLQSNSAVLLLFGGAHC
jgi:hypothetical protein